MILCDALPSRLELKSYEAPKFAFKGLSLQLIRPLFMPLLFCIKFVTRAAIHSTSITVARINIIKSTFPFFCLFCFQIVFYHHKINLSILLLLLFSNCFYHHKINLSIRFFSNCFFCHHKINLSISLFVFSNCFYQMRKTEEISKGY
jgi:hypothetical protein